MTTCFYCQAPVSGEDLLATMACLSAGHIEDLDDRVCAACAERLVGPDWEKTARVVQAEWRRWAANRDWRAWYSDEIH